MLRIAALPRQPHDGAAGKSLLAISIGSANGRRKLGDKEKAIAINEAKLNDFMGQFVHDFGAAMHVAIIVVGDQLGLYKALDGVAEWLQQGARVADVGCGHVALTILMAQAYPASSFVGFDYHAPSVERAREAAMKAGLGKQVRFEVASAKDFPGKDYDRVAVFDCLHDMGDPVGASAHVKSSLKPDGAGLIVEPFANDRLEDNLNPVGRGFFCASTFICTPASRAQEVGLCLGAQAGEARVREVVTIVYGKRWEDFNRNS